MRVYTISNFRKKSHRSYEPYVVRIVIILVFVCLAFIICGDSSANIWHPTLPLTDSSVFHYVASIMQKGGSPYKDVFDHKGPLIYFINYLGHLVGGMNGVWLFELLAIFLMVLFSYLCIRLFTGKLLSVFGTIIVTFLLYDFLGCGNYVEEFALPFIACSTWIYTDFFINNKTTKLKLLLCGACFMSVFLLRQNMIALWLVLSVFVLLIEIESKSSRFIFYLLWFTGGAVAVLVPVLTYLGIKDALKDFWEQYFVFNFTYSTVSAVKRFYAVWHFFSTVPSVVSFLILLVSMLTDSQRHKISAYNLIYFFVSLFFVGLSGRTYSHYGILLIPLCVVPMGLLMEYLDRNAYNKRLLVGSLILSTILAFYPWISVLQRTSALAPVETSLEGIISSFIKTNTSADDYIMVLGNKDIFYLLSERESASKYSYQMPIAMMDENIYKIVVRDIYQNKPSVMIVQDTETGSDFEMTKLMEIAKAYASTQNFEYETKIGLYTIYMREFNS